VIDQLKLDCFATEQVIC